MSKSSPSTSTTVVQNPLANAQLPYLTNMWGAAAGLSGWNGSGVDPTQAAGYNYLQQLQTAANNNYTTAFPFADQVVPGANQFTMNALAGNLPQSAYAAGPQIGSLTGLGGNAVGNAGMMQAMLSNAAMTAPQYVAGSAEALNNVGNAAYGLMPYGTQAYGNLTGLGQQAAGNLTGLGQQAVGALTGLAPSAIAAGQPAQAGLAGTAGAAMANPALASGLAGVASGAYIDPRTNPALGGVMQAATQPLVNQYQTATAPGISSSAEAAGRYGSGALQNQQSLAQYNLGQALATATSGIANNAYNTGLGVTVNAGGALGNIYNTGVANAANAFQGLGALAQTGVQNAGNLMNQGYSTGGNLVGQGYNTGGQLMGAGANALQGIGSTALSNAANAFGTGGQLNVGGLNAMLGGIGTAGQIGNQGYQIGGGMLGQAGQLANAGQLDLASIAQNAPTLANFPLSQAAAAYNTNWMPIQNYASILGGPAGQSSTTSATTPYYQNVPQSIVSGLSGLSSLGTLFGKFSDRRLKTDIRRAGRFLNGLPLYTFRYLGSDHITLGAMADDVERFRPEAVTVGPGGYKVVDYSLALQ